MFLEASVCNATPDSTIVAGLSPLNAADIHSMLQLLRIPSGHCFAEDFIKYPMMNISPRLLLLTPWSTSLMSPADLITTLLSSTQRMFNALLWFHLWWHPWEVWGPPSILLERRCWEKHPRGNVTHVGTSGFCCKRLADAWLELRVRVWIVASACYHWFSKFNVLIQKLDLKNQSPVSLTSHWM